MTLHQEIPYQDPMLFLAYFKDKSGTVFFDSASLIPGISRYGFLCVDPFSTIKAKNDRVEIDGHLQSSDPFTVLQKLLAKYARKKNTTLSIPFQGGTAGYWGYECHHHLEKRNLKPTDDRVFPDMILGLYDLVIAFDYQEKRAWVISNGLPALDDVSRNKRARERLDWILDIMSQLTPLPSPESSVLKDEEIQSNFTQENYFNAVKKVKNTILAGDIFEANISQRFKASLPLALSPFELYRRLRQFNPAPFSAYMMFDEVVLLSASPERFLKLTNGLVETRPIKGTRPRGKTPEEDALLARELQNSEKDHAENTMIVDLLRNDLSKVCEPLSVTVPQLCGLESYTTVHHLVSVVEGKLKPSFTAVDLFRSAFPGGSITGAPKIQSMEVIADVEPTQRGPYCGVIGYVEFNGNMDTAIAIRTFAIDPKTNTVTFQAGGAVVLDSDPESEYQETLAKAKGLRRALCESLVD